MNNLLPIIDLDESDAQIKLRFACENWGFFYLKNPGVNFGEVFDQMKLFFDLPVDSKMRSLKNKANLGYTTFGDETVGPEVQTCGDTKEG